MLELVSLTPTEAKRRVRNYSLGMRQRLGIATALLGDPQVLILDEPANGLDPGEVRTLREHLRRRAAGGAAVLISSHLLAEIELLATHCVVMNQGAVITAGRLEDLLGTGSYEFEVDDARRAEEALRGVDGVESVDPHGKRLVVSAPGRTVNELNQVLVMAGVGVGAVRSTRSLEDVFLGLVERNSAAN
jgi:ABC-2 type transport system ATP-binding protein